mgnify:CR=1 FL=1
MKTERVLRESRVSEVENYNNRAEPSVLLNVSNNEEGEVNWDQ